MLSQALGLSPKRSNALLNYVLDQSGVTSSGRLAEGSLSEIPPELQPRPLPCGCPVVTPRALVRKGEPLGCSESRPRGMPH